MELLNISTRDNKATAHHISAGFTLLEVTIVIGIFALLISVGLFMSMQSFTGFIYRSEVATIVSMMQRARSRSMANIDQSPWGVCYIAPNYVIVKGSACVSSAAVDTIAANTSVATASDFLHTFPKVTFTSLSGTTTATSTTVTQTGKTQIISINNEGTISW